MASPACPSHPIPGGEELRFILAWGGSRALLLDTKLGAINPRLLLLLFNVQIIDFHWLFSFDTAWLINAHTKWLCHRVCAVEGQGSSVFSFFIPFDLMEPVACAKMYQQLS